MKLVGKCISFVKENKIIVFALAVVLLSFIFLALPGQFAHYQVNQLGKHPTYDYNLSGYDFMFGIAKHKTSGNDMPHVKPIAQGIAIFVMLILCVPGLLFSKKSSFVALLTSLALITIAVLLFTISAASYKAYGEYKIHVISENHDYSNISWVPYLLGAFILIAGLAMSYRTFLVMKEEVKHPTQPKGPSYNYLHK